MTFSPNADKLTLWALNETSMVNATKKRKISLNRKSSLKIGQHHECSTADRYGVKLFGNDGPAPEMPAGARPRVLDTYQFLFAPESNPRLQEDTDFPPRCTSG